MKYLLITILAIFLALFVVSYYHEKAKQKKSSAKETAVYMDSISGVTYLKSWPETTPEQKTEVLKYKIAVAKYCASKNISIDLKKVDSIFVNLEMTIYTNLKNKSE